MMAGHGLCSCLAAIKGISKNRCRDRRSYGASQLPQQLSFRQLDDVQDLMIFGIF